MRSTSRSVLRLLDHEGREIRRHTSALRRQRPYPVGVPDLPTGGSVNPLAGAPGISGEQHDEVVRRRLADKSLALAVALDRLREGTYGICQECGCQIPERRLEVMPTATLCVPCQERRERPQP